MGFDSEDWATKGVIVLPGVLTDKALNDMRNLASELSETKTKSNGHWNARGFLFAKDEKVRFFVRIKAN